MSSFLYGLARSAYRRRLTVLISWLGALAVLGGLAGVLGGSFDEKFTLPGTESQVALDSLNRTFPQAGGTSAQVIVVPPAGDTVKTAEVRSQVEDAITAYEGIAQVDGVNSPYDTRIKGLVAPDDTAAIVQIRLAVAAGEIEPATYEALEAETRALQDALPGSTTSIGGEAYSDNRPGVSITEAIGLVVALIVLLLTLGSLRAAGMPILTALLGVGITMTLIFLATAFTTVSSTTPLLALMLGLAVGIDYALFILSRHRDQLGHGLDPEESTAQAVATAGSAVVFAGLTVMIALVGLSVAGIPFLTTMGVAAAVGVAIAVLIALTLLPALLGFAGERLRPKVRTPRTSPAARAASRQRVPFRRRWVRLVTKVPVLTIVVVVAALGAMAVPAKDLRIALPSNGNADPGTPARVTYDLVDRYFGVGYNGPLIVTATIVSSDDPLQLMDDMADDIRALPGVADVPLATPNEDASTGIIQVVPTGGPDSEETKALVERIRSMQPYFLDTYGVNAYVTGFTAVAIDVSDRLGAALLPFGLVVVGLSVVLLLIIFRSIAVPIKATIGYLLSVGASFGATAMVFEYGWFSEIFNVEQTAPVISFLPILLMGILFGLAMDYEVFLVSRMREEFVHRGDAHAAIEDGFAASGRVVVAAAVIMFSVFAAFVPEGEGPIKTISFGLAVGVFIDAFLVRMTLVPAVLALLGKSAWWLPDWLGRRLPHFDVEGEGLAHQMAVAQWTGADNRSLIVADGVPLGSEQTVAARIEPGEVLVVDELSPVARQAVLLTLTGRMVLLGGRLQVAGLVLPEQNSAVRRRTAYLDAYALLLDGLGGAPGAAAAVGTAPGTRGRSAGSALAAALRSTGKASVVVVDHADALTDDADRAAVAALIRDAAARGDRAIVLGVEHRDRVADLLTGARAVRSLDLSARPALDPAIAGEPVSAHA